MTEWTGRLGLTAALCFALSRFGLPRYRMTMQVSAAVSALLGGAMLAGPPFDEIAGAIIILTVFAIALWAYISGKA